MVAQIPDRLLLDEQELSIVAVNGSELFNPAAYGLRPGPGYKACWRGYLCQYALVEGRLVLDEVKLSLMEAEAQGAGEYGCAGPAINGVRPIFRSQPGPALNNTYEWLNLEVAFTGGLLAAAGLVEEHYIQLGFQPAWQYQTVIELVFEAGAVCCVRDVSQSVAALRDALARAPLLPNPHVAQESLRAWIAASFHLRYNL